MQTNALGQIVVLNGAPRSGKSSIVEAIQRSFDGVWMNLGVDVYVRHVTPEKLRPGIGLRPGAERSDIAPHLQAMYLALYDSAAAHSRLGLNVVMDLGHHDEEILSACARRLAGLPAVLVGVRCPFETILERRRNSDDGAYVAATAADPLPLPVLLWQEEVHKPGIYDLEVDTSVSTPEECADQLAQLLASDRESPTAFDRLAAL